MADTQRMQNFRFWCQKVLPAVYDDSFSYYELLCKVVNYINQVIDELNNHGDAITELQDAVNKLQCDFEKFKESGFDDYYAAQIDKWIRDNAAYIFSIIGKQVWFGLTSTGYFCAYVPDGWQDIEFDTGAVYGAPSYGRLILRYNVDGSGVIDNTGYGEGIGLETAKELQSQIDRLNITCYTPLMQLFKNINPLS